MSKRSPRGARRKRRRQVVDQGGRRAGTTYSEQAPSCPSPSRDASTGVGPCEPRPDPNPNVTTEPYVLAIARMQWYESVEDMERDLGPEAVVREFMRGPYDADDCMPAADCVSGICPGASLTSLGEEDRAAGCEKIALVHEASLTDDGKCSEYASEPLSALDLSRKHLARVIDVVHDQTQPNRHGHPDTEATNTTTNASRKGSKDRASRGICVKAAQRRMYAEDGPSTSLDLTLVLVIFVTDLNRRSIRALINSCPSHHESRQLRDAIYKHISAETHIGVTFATDALGIYRYSFHLPYYVWQDWSEPSDDPRYVLNCRRLRTTQEVTVLNLDRGPGATSRSFLYEAHTTCVVAGSDPRTWVGWCFVDTYYGAKTDVRESAEQYYTEGLAAGGPPMDPFLYGTKATGDQMWSASDFFLSVVIARTGQVVTQWQKVVDKVRNNVRAYEQDNQAQLRMLRMHATAPHDRSTSIEELERSRAWIRDETTLLQMLSQRLSLTLRECQDFTTAYSAHSGGFHWCGDKLGRFQAAINDLATLNKALTVCTNQCNVFIHNLELQLSSDTNTVGNQQRMIATDSKNLNLVFILFATPLALTLATFTLDTAFIPFIPRRFESFVIVNMVYCAISIIILQAIRYWGQTAVLYRLLMQWRLRWQPVFADIATQEPEMLGLGACAEATA